MTIRKTLANLVLGASLAMSPYLAQAPSLSYAAQQSSSQSGTIDLQAADSGEYKYQRGWISFFNEKGIAMIDCSDVYRAGQTGSDELLKSLREDFRQGALITSTRFACSQKSVDGVVMHNFGSTVVMPTESKVDIPYYESMKLNKVLETSQGLQYLRTLFNTQDSAENIAKTLQRLSGKSIEDTYVWTPTQSYRQYRSFRTVWFNYDDGGFHVGGSGWVDEFGGGLGGRSRGVSVKR
jgi:hypothetical protein